MWMNPFDKFWKRDKYEKAWHMPFGILIGCILWLMGLGLTILDAVMNAFSRRR